MTFPILISLLLLINGGENLEIAEVNMHVDGKYTSIGVLRLLQRDANDAVRIYGFLRDLPPNTVHGFHAHTNGLTLGQYNCSLAGAHFNPYNTPHGPPSANISARHVGDLGNVTTDDNGIITLNMTDSIIQLFRTTPRLIANRTLVLHAMRDDGGTGGYPDSNSTGNAGARIACGVIREPPYDQLIKRSLFPPMIDRSKDFDRTVKKNPDNNKPCEKGIC